MHGPEDDTVRSDFDPGAVDLDAPHVLGGRYRVEGLLGRGGMGSVYVAHDLELGERVAVKLLSDDSSDPRSAERLRDEVRIARRITHPNVARTYDLGVHAGRRFLTMELVDGASLREVLHTQVWPRADRLVLLEQVASGLAAIHREGVVHRDLKPENVLVSTRGVAKITDFGIALRADSVPRSTAGTPRYMAPEILRGAPPTFASDVFSLGLVAYDVLAEQAPVTRQAGLGSSIDLHSLDRDVRGLVERCVSEDPTRRPTAEDVIAALAALRGHAAPATIAVPRPLRPATRVGVAAFDVQEGAEPWLATSLAADVLRVLVAVPELEVTASILPAANAVRDARELGLRAVVRGSVRRAADDLVVTVRLVAVDDALLLWARTFSAPMTSMLAELEDAAATLTKALAVHQRPVATPLKADPKVVELYLRAAEAEHRPWRDWQNDAPEFFRKALDLAPDDPVLLAGLALSLLRGGPPYESTRYLTARDAADRALLHGSRSANVQLACGSTLFVSNEGASAVHALRAALSLAPSLPDAHAMLGSIAAQIGLLDEAVARSRLALALAPKLAIARVNAATALEMRGDVAGCDQILAEGLTEPGTFAHFLSALCTTRFALWRGTDADVSQAAERLAPFEANPLVEALLALLRDRAVGVALGALAPLRLASAEWARQQAVGLQLEVELHLWGGDHDAALTSLARLVQTGTFESAWFEACPLLAKIQSTASLQRAKEIVSSRAAPVREAMWSLGQGTLR